jgi:hypothetical protein
VKQIDQNWVSPISAPNSIRSAFDLQMLLTKYGQNFLRDPHGLANVMVKQVPHLNAAPRDDTQRMAA